MERTPRGYAHRSPSRRRSLREQPVSSGLTLKAPGLPGPHRGALGLRTPCSSLNHFWFVGTEADLCGGVLKLLSRIKASARFYRCIVCVATQEWLRQAVPIPPATQAHVICKATHQLCLPSIGTDLLVIGWVQLGKCSPQSERAHPFLE